LLSDINDFEIRTALFKWCVCVCVCVHRFDVSVTNLIEAFL